MPHAQQLTVQFRLQAPEGAPRIRACTNHAKMPFIKRIAEYFITRMFLHQQSTHLLSTIRSSVVGPVCAWRVIDGEITSLNQPTVGKHKRASSICRNPNSGEHVGSGDVLGYTVDAGR